MLNLVVGSRPGNRTAQTARVSGGELAIVVAAVVLGATIKAVTGMGLPLVAIPVAAMFVDLADAVAVIALPNVVANGVLAAREVRCRHETRDLPVLAATGVAGAVVGTFVLVSVPGTPLVLALVVAILGYVVLFVSSPDLRTTPAQSRRWSPAVGSAAGLFQGAIGISGPVVGSWIHSYRLPRGAHILSVTSLFFVIGVAQLVVLVASRELSGLVGATLLACVPVLASIPIGTAIRRRISPGGFDVAVVGILAVSAVALCVRTFL